MKTIFILLSILIARIAPAAPGPEALLMAPSASVTDSGPKIQFATPIYDLGRVKSGEPVKVDFVFTNVGQTMLEITAVNPGCHCTTAGDWSHQVEPGKTGHIPIQYNPATATGPFIKNLVVTCNDKSQPTISLQFKGTLWKPVEVAPQYAAFNGTAEALSHASSVVHIVNNEDAALTLSPPESNNPIFAAELNATKPGKEFEVTIRVARPLETQNAQGIITLKTSSTNTPVVSINAVAILQPLPTATSQR